MNIFLRWVLRSIILCLGIFGNLTGLVVFLGKGLKNFPPRRIYTALAIVDTSFITIVITLDFLNNLGFKFKELNEYSCKITYYVGYFLSPISAWLLVFISLHRYISIRFQSVKIFNKPLFQIGVIGAIIAYNLILYSPILFLVSFINTNRTENNETKCVFSNNKRFYMTIIDFINAVKLPFLFMLILSILLIFTIVKSRLTIIRMTNNVDKKKLRKSIQFAISSIFSNLIFLVLNFPFTISLIIYFESELQDYLDCLYYFSFCVNFYILFCFNSVYRNGVFKLARIRKSK